MAPLVRLAGYNLDSDLIQDVLSLLEAIEREAGDLSPDQAQSLLRSLADQIRSNLSSESFTPETISAAYARISRDPKHVTELRRAARLGVARARKSNESIIFGLGHASVAEHASFNFDVSGISRFASEELQSHRLLSFTEKSQRYITINADYVVPPEVLGTGWEARFHEIMPVLFSAYDAISADLVRGYMPAGTSSLSKQEARDLENKAKEDARYLLPLACCTQMGMTMNARNAEHVVLELSDHPLTEVRQLGAALASAVGNLAPSLVKYTARGTYPRANRQRLRQVYGDDKWLEEELELADSPVVRFVAATEDGEQKILRAIAFANGNRPYADATSRSAQANEEQIWRTVFEGLGSHDPVLRELEVTAMTFEVEISASCFAQLKRHRMMTLLAQDYGSVSGAIIPPSIEEAGLSDKFLAAVRWAQDAACELHGDHPQLAPYLLTNAHKKRVLMHANARELYHFARLRCDEHAQWEIRRLGQQVMEIAWREWPNVFRLACGKDRFAETYRRIYPEDPAT
jgi:flavin-dependent thymidylate synthase